MLFFCLPYCNRYIYRVTHKSLRDFRTRLRNNQDRQTDTAERSISIDRESLQVLFWTRRRGVLAGFTARGAVVTKRGVDRE
jgi:hypothetical protein